MKNLRSLFVVYIAMFTVMFSAAQFAFAQESYQPPADIEEFRRNLDQMIQDLYRHRETFRQNPAVREALESGDATQFARLVRKVSDALLSRDFRRDEQAWDAAGDSDLDWQHRRAQIGAKGHQASRCLECDWQ